MFIQVIQGASARQDEVLALLAERRDSRPDDAGWLGTTYGFTDDGQFVGVVRFESREEAMANSARPETHEFATRMAALFDGPPTFRDCDDVTTFLDGGSDDAGFVQVIQGKVDDPARLKAFITNGADQLRAMRPEIVGGTLAFEADGSFTETVAFRSESAAREGERTEPPPEIREELDYAMQGATFFDLKEPHFA